MAYQYSYEGSSTSNVPSESSGSAVQLNIKTLDSQIYSFHMDINMPVSVFKEKIANKIGLPVSQQRLIFRGKVLKDDHLLSEYHVENGHTLHLVERQPVQAQPSGTSSSETTGYNGNDAGSGGPRNRVGQISHSVVLGTFNVEDQGEGTVPDLSRVVGAVLNSIGIGSQTTANVATTAQSSPPNLHGQASQGNETEEMLAGSQNQAGNQAQSVQAFPSQPFQSLPQVVPIPLAAGAIPVPSLHVPIPDSLSTLSEFMNRMEQTFSQNGYRPNLSSTNARELPRVELPSSSQGLPTPEALSIVLCHAGRLLGGHAVAALSQIAGRLEQEGASSDSSVRSEIQTESMQIGLVMQHLGALLLELGRTVMTLRMGRSPAESVMNAGPAVYISPSGPNPIMAQPFPLQTSSLFGGSVRPSNSATFGPVGVGSATRHTDPVYYKEPLLHQLFQQLVQEQEMGKGDRVNAIMALALVLQDQHRSYLLEMSLQQLFHRSTGVAVASAAQSGLGVSVSQPPPDSVSLPSVISVVNSRIRNFFGNLQGDNVAPSGQVESTSQNSSVGSESRDAERDQHLHTMEGNRAGDSSVSLVSYTSENEGQKGQADSEKTCNNKETSVSSLKDYYSISSNEGSLSRSSGGGTISKSVDIAENAPCSSEKHNSTEGSNLPLGLGLGGLEHKRHGKQQNPLVKTANVGTSSSPLNGSEPSPGQFPSSDGQIGVGSVMSQESPQMTNTVNQIAQQVGSQDPGNMFAGMEGGQGGGSGGIDSLSMFQRMMPIVSQALSSGTNVSQPSPDIQPEWQAQYSDGILSRDDNPNDQSTQINLPSVVQRIEHLNQPGDVFSAVVANVFRLSGGGSASDDLVNDLCSDEGTGQCM
ncbi:Large proline-rich protein BAG6 [Quillaja saponaria]|uniref:Large proline-rich protein BAG6 n=1 Tax=Quillaja saponaria TaxID=32244 RepID=A0AAD7LYZ6_QUISA|nr:Large proline-rich protein BAG6 [Quillaja saponaria]